MNKAVKKLKKLKVALDTLEAKEDIIHDELDEVIEELEESNDD